MDNKSSFASRELLLLGVFKTIYLFLLNHNLSKSAEIFKNECGLYSGNIDSVSSKSLLLKKCKCSKNQANQTDQKSIPKDKNEWLEGTYEGGPFRLKDDQTHIFYVCDHCQQISWNSGRKMEGLQCERQKDKIDEGSASKSELIMLQYKFSELQGEHQKLIAVTSELTSALQMNIIGQTKNIHSVLEHCKSIYPSLFTPASPQMPIFENIEKESKTRKFFFDNNGKSENCFEFGEPDNKEEHRKEEKNSQNFENLDLHQHVEPLILENLSSRSPLKTPLTPETVRHILETVFEKIFELEKTKSQKHDADNPVLNKDEVDKIVGDVLNDLSKTPFNLNGAGEGEMSRPDLMKETIVMRSDIFFDVDYAKIKRDLKHSDNEKKIRILQALRWRITKNDGSIREKVMESYATHDILEIRSATSLPEHILSGYGNDHFVQESTCRLINTLASVRQGRDYLTTDDRLLKKVLIKKVKEIKNVTSAVIRNMLVASVQKLSIRKQCRTLMVQEGLFEVMVDYLQEFHDELSRYCLEYCSALLMNLCLVDEAKQRSTRNPKKVIGLIRQILEGESEYCIPYINGVMFSLLEKEEIINEAKHQNLDKLLIRIIRVTNNENIRKQLDFIVQSRLFGKGDTGVTDSDEENRDEVDLLEIELDQDDFITPLPSGERLLEEYKAEKSSNCVSFSTIRKDPPPSAKSFSEETKQFRHKPSTERGIFESTRPRRYTTCSQNVIRNHVKNKKYTSSYGRFPATPLCYADNCQRLTEGSGAPCTCSKCIPGQSRYTCGCYDAICREIAEVENEEHGNNLDDYSTPVDFGKFEGKNSQLPLPEITDKESPKSISGQTNSTTHISELRSDQIDNTAIVEQIPDHDNKNGGRTGSGCKVCGEKKCECAFDPRPKLCRTPTL